MESRLKRPNPFRWPTAQQPIEVIEISSDEDEAAPAQKIAKTTSREAAFRGITLPHTTSFPPEKWYLLTTTQHKGAEAEQEAQFLSQAFRDCIASHVPLHLIDQQVRQDIRWYADWLLEMAGSEGASIHDVSIDDNCLPTWPGLVWDPEFESLHQVMQRRLMEHQRAEEVSERVRRAIVHLANARLAEARARGVRLRNVVIGADLLPTWPGRDPNAEDHGEEDGDADCESSEDGYSDMECPDSVHTDVERSVSSGNTAQTSHHAEEEEEEAAQAMQLSSAWSSDSESDLSLSEYDDEISLRNFVHGVPTIEESDDEDIQPGNIIFDVDLHRAPVEGTSLDFEVYLADMDTDVEELLEAELAIEGDGFAHHYHLVDAVDIELADGNVYCIVSQDEMNADHCSDMFPGSTNASSVNSPSHEPATPASVRSDIEVVAEAGAEAASGEWILI